MKKRIVLLMLCGWLLLSGHASAWFDKTHIAMGLAVYGSEAGYAEYVKRQGFTSYYDLGGPDMVKIRSSYEDCNHYYNRRRGEGIDIKVVDGQAEKIKAAQVCTKADPGRLYGAIMESLDQYVAKKRKGEFADYYMAYAGHYIGDLVMPLHNMVPPRGPDQRIEPAFAAYHRQLDGLVDGEIDIRDFSQPRIAAHMRDYTLNSRDEVAAKLLELAAESSRRGYLWLDAGLPEVTSEEVYTQLGAGASFFKAVQAFAENEAKKPKLQ